MRKVFSIFTIFIVILLSTGCSKEKKLECKKSSSVTQGVEMTQTYNITFDKNKINNLDIRLDFSLDDTTINMSQTFYDSIKQQYENEYKKYKGVTINSNKESDRSFNFKILFDYNVLTQEEKEELGFNGSEDYEANKKVLEEKEYICN